MNYCKGKVDWPSSAYALCAALCLMMFASNVDASSRGVTVKLKASESISAKVIGEQQLYTDSYALVIANNDYDHWSSLNGAIKDGRLIADALRKKGFQVTFKTNLGSTQLENTLKRFFIKKGANPDARLFVWYAGHGHTLKGEGFLVPTDAPLPTKNKAAVAEFRLHALPLRRFEEYVRSAESKHAYSIFDSCFSGTIFMSQRSMPPAAITQATTLPVRQFLSSGGVDQQVSDDGKFRKMFLRALNGDGKGDANGDGYLTASEIGMFMKNKITNLTNGHQTPNYGKLNDEDYDRGDFVFVLPQLAADQSEQKLVARVAPIKPTEPSRATLDLEYWNSIKSSQNTDMYRSYLESFPSGQFTKIAKLKIGVLKKKRNNYSSPSYGETRKKRALELRVKNLEAKLTEQKEDVFFVPPP
ncbi:MAG: caspase family protein [Mariprofundaceae bacterium]